MNTQNNTAAQIDPKEQVIIDQLDAIFGTPKTLNETEQAQVQAIYKQMETLFETIGERKPTAEEEQQIDKLGQQADAIYGVKSWDSLTDEEKQKVETLYEQLEDLSGEGVNPEEEALYKELDGIFGIPKELSTEEQQQADTLITEIENIYEAAGENELSADDQAKVDGLEKQLDQLYGVKSWDQLSSEEQARVEQIFTQLDEFEGGEEMEIDEETQALYDRLDEIYGTPKELNAEEQQQADALEAQIDALFDDMEEDLTEAQEQQLDQLFGQLDTLYGMKSDADLTDAEKQEVEQILAQLDAKEQEMMDEFEDDFGEDSFQFGDMDELEGMDGSELFGNFDDEGEDGGEDWDNWEGEDDGENWSNWENDGDNEDWGNWENEGGDEDWGNWEEGGNEVAMTGQADFSYDMDGWF